MSNIQETCDKLLGFQKRRRYIIQIQSKLNRTIEHYIAGLLGYNSYLSPAEKKRIWKLVVKTRKDVEAGKGQPAAVNGALTQTDIAMIVEDKIAREVYDQLRNEYESIMEKLASTLPVSSFVEGVRGVGLLGLAVIVGEAGNLSRYKNRGALEHRLGVACTEGGERQRRKKGVSGDEARRIGYNPRRRAEIWAFLDHVMMRHQWAGDKDEDRENPVKSGKPVAFPAHPLGPYGEHYARKKAEYLARDWPAGHAHNAAKRYAAKMFLRHLWRKWRLSA